MFGMFYDSLRRWARRAFIGPRFDVIAPTMQDVAGVRWPSRFVQRVHVNPELLADPRAEWLLVDIARPIDSNRDSACLERILVPTQPTKPIDGMIEMVVYGRACRA